MIHPTRKSELPPISVDEILEEYAQPHLKQRGKKGGGYKPRYSTRPAHGKKNMLDHFEDWLARK